MDEAEAAVALIPRFRTLEEADRHELCSQATHSEEQSQEKRLHLPDMQQPQALTCPSWGIPIPHSVAVAADAPAPATTAKCQDAASPPLQAPPAWQKTGQERPLSGEGEVPGAVEYGADM